MWKWLEIQSCKAWKTRRNCFRYLKLMSPLNVAIYTTISYTLWVEWYYLKNNYLTLRSKVKDPRRSLWYVTHRLMVMHPHTKYHWPISKDENVMARTRKYYLKNYYLTLRSKIKVPRRSLWYVTHRLMVMHIQTIFQWSFVGFIWIIWPWGQRTRSYKGHYSTWHTALWSCTHIPIIIDLPRKTKMLWPGQENTI